MDDIEHRIREQAFYLWEQAGCPDGRADEFWQLAEQTEGRQLPPMPILGEDQPAETGAEDDPARAAGF